MMAGTTVFQMIGLHSNLLQRIRLKCCIALSQERKYLTFSGYPGGLHDCIHQQLATISHDANDYDNLDT
jgi:hypothetical protein